MLPRLTPGQDPMPLHTGLVDRVNFSIQFEKYHRMLFKRWWILVIFLGVGLLYGGLRALILPDIYMASGSMMVSPRINTTISDTGISEELMTFLKTQLQYMRSRQVLDKVRAHLADYERTLPVPPDPDPCVDLMQGTAIFPMQVYSASAEYSKRYLTEWQLEFIAFKKQMRTKISEDAVGSLLREAERLGKELGQEQDQLFDFEKKNNIKYLQEENSSTDKDSLFLLRAERDELAKFLRPNHPKLARLDDEISHKEWLMKFALSDTKEGEGKGVPKTLTREEEQQQIVDANQKLAQYTNLKATVDRTKELQELVKKKLSEVDANKGVEQETVTINEDAYASPFPVGPRRLRMILFSGFAGLALAVGIILLLEKFDDRVRNVEEFQSHVEETILGQVPSVVRQEGVSGELLGFDKPDFESFSESFRNTRSSLMFSPTAGTAKVIGITSALPSDGKTTCAVNLSACLARLEEQKVLLIDADMRRMSVHRYFKRENGKGLSEILSGQAGIHDCVIPSGLPNLDLLCAGASPPNPGELILSKNFKLLLETASQLYRRVIIDTAPVLATDDVLSLAPTVDGMIFVVKAEQTSMRLVQRAVELLKERGVKIFGMILNNVDTTAAHYYYQYYYSNYYYHGHRKERGSPPKGDQPGTGDRGQKGDGKGTAHGAGNEKRKMGFKAGIGN